METTPRPPPPPPPPPPRPHDHKPEIAEEEEEEEEDDDNKDDDRDGKKESTVDGLSSLPCHLLERILSYLPTKSVVPTALLSRRWRYVWASTLHLDLDDTGVPECQSAKFKRFVDLSIASRRHPSALLVFRLILHCYYHHITVGRWLRDADLFDLSSLRILRLSTCRYALSVSWPSSARLPSLDTLELVGIRFDPPVAADFVSSACPRLRSCSLTRCRPLSRLDVNCVLLEELFIASFHGRSKLQDLCITAGRLKWLSVMCAFALKVKTTLAISAPSIERFMWYDVVPHEYRAASPTSPLRSQVVSSPGMITNVRRTGCPANILTAFA